MDDGSRCLSDVIGDPSALKSFLEGGENSKSSPSLKHSLKISNSEIDPNTRKNGSIKRSSTSWLLRENTLPYRISSAQTVVNLPTQVVLPTQSPSPLCHSVASPQIGQSPKSQNALQQQVCSPAQPSPPPVPSPFSICTRSPLQPSPSPCQNNLLSLHSPIPQPMPCPSPSNHLYPIQSPIQMSAPSPVQNLYQSKSPATTPSPLPFTSLPQSKSPASHGSIATQVRSPLQPNTSPAPHIASSPVPAQALVQQQVNASVAATLNINPGVTSCGAQMVQFLSAPAANQSSAPMRVSSNVMKPIQPKQPQILPKPVGTGQNQFGGSLNKPVTVNRNAISVASNQPNSIMIGQNQATMLPNHNMAMSGQGTLLFNGISLGLAQNPILIQGGAGGLQNLQLLVRPQQPGTLTSSSQSNAQQGVNPAALLAAWQVQNQAAHQAMLGPAKGQTVVIPGTNLLTSSAAQPTTLAANQTLHSRPNVIVNQRMVNGNQGALQIQQIQTAHGPIALAIAPQPLRSLHNANLTLANAQTGSGAGTVGSVIQGMTLPQATQSQLQGATLPAGVVLNSHSLAQSQTSSLTPVTVTLSQDSLSVAEHSSQPLQVSKAPSVNLEELLKQAGIVPADPIPPPQPSQPSATVMTNTLLPTTSVVSIAQSQPIITQMQASSQPTVVLNSAHIPVSHSSSQLLTQLQRPVSVNQSQQSQHPLKLSINQVGGVFLQRPIVATPNLNQASLTATTPSIPSEVQPIPSMLLQRLNDVPQVSTAMPEPTASLIPLTVQNINLPPPSHPQTLLAVTSQCTSACSTITTSAVQNNVVTTTTISGLMQTHPTLAQSLGQTNSMAGSTNPVLNQALNQKLAKVHQPSQQNAALTENLMNHHPLNSSVTLTTHTATTTTVTPTVISATIPTVTAIVKTEPTNLFLTSSPITTLSAGQKLQTIQLTPQNQEHLQKVQNQLCYLLNQKNHTPQQRQQLLQLQATQQKIISQGKVISIQQSPNQAIHLVQQHQQPQLVQAQQQKSSSLATQSSNIQSSSLATHPSAPTSGSISGTTQQGTSKQNVHLSNLLKQVPNQPASVRVVSTPTQNTSTSASITVPTQVKIGNQLITLTSQQRQTFQQLQQQLKSLTPEQQQLFLSQNKQAVILKLQQQQPSSSPVQTAGQSSTFTPTTSSGAPTIAVATTSGIAGSLLVIQPNRGIKRPAPTPLPQTALFQKQLTDDEQGVLHPDCKTPFRSVTDACKRLLKYHVFNSKTPTQKDIQKADDLFETVSEQLRDRAHHVFGKYSCLLLKEGTRDYPTAELVMLQKLFVEDEKESLKVDKQAVEDGEELDLPPLPDHWLEKESADLCTTSSVTTACIATTQASSHMTTATTTVHVAPLLSLSPVVNKIDSKDICTKEYSQVTCATTSNNATKSLNKKDGKDELNALEQVQGIKEEKTHDKSSFGCKIKQEVVVKEEIDKNYDEWAEIQKELEMYPLEGDHSDGLELSSAQVDFDPPESSSSLADFEPPVAKSAIGSSAATYLGSLVEEVPRPLHTSVQSMESTGSLEVMDASADWEMYNSGDEQESDSNHLLAESQAAVESILQPEEAQLDLSDIEEFNRHYSSEGEVGKNSPSIRCNGVNEQKEVTMSSTILMEGVDGEDIAIEQSLKSPDDDLNAQVESAINSILNLQRTDDSFDYVETESYALDGIESKEEEQMHLDYETPPIELDTCEVVDAALEEAVKSILM